MKFYIHFVSIYFHIHTKIPSLKKLTPAIFIFFHSSFNNPIDKISYINIQF